MKKVVDMVISCDRCGKRFCGKEHAKVSFTKPKQDMTETILCGSCSRAYERWLRAFNREVKTNAES